MNSAPYNLEKPPPLNFLELHLKERGYIWYAVCLTSDEHQVQEQMRSCCKRIASCPGLELVSTQNQWVTRFWMRTQSIAVERGDATDDQMSLPLGTTKRSSVPPPLPAQLSGVQPVPSLFPSQPEPGGETFASASPTVPSDPPDGSIRCQSTLPAPSDRLTLPDGPEGAWHEPGSATPAMRPPPIKDDSTDSSTNEVEGAPPSSAFQAVDDTELVETGSHV